MVQRCEVDVCFKKNGNHKFTLNKFFREPFLKEFLGKTLCSFFFFLQMQINLTFKYFWACQIFKRQFT